MYPLTINGNKYVGAQHRVSMADIFKRWSGIITPRSCDPKIDAKINNTILYCTSPLDYRLGTIDHPGPHIQ